MAEREDDLKRLETLFDAARRDPPGLPEGLAARILADAAACQAERPGPLPEDSQSDAASLGAVIVNLLGQFRRAVGGWPAVGGMAVASAAGLWIGLAPPSFLPDPVDLVQASSETPAMPYESYDLALLLDEEME